MTNEHLPERDLPRAIESAGQSRESGTSPEGTASAGSGRQGPEADSRRFESERSVTGDDTQNEQPTGTATATQLPGLSALHGELAESNKDSPFGPPPSADPPPSEDFGKWAEPEAPKRSIDTMVGKVVDGRYEIKGMLGRGGMGAVFEAWQPSVQRTVALKVLLREFAENETVIKRFHKEALAASRLQHPNTISVYDFGQTDDGILFIAMEYLRGVDLSRVLEEGPMPIDRALAIMRQVCRSLSEAHKAGVIHRDLKPDNVFLTDVEGEDDFVKVLDFGVAKLKEGDGQERTLTQAGTMFGTPKYMSPEQTRSTQVDARSDIYSLGVIFYEMLMGEPPFVSDNPLSILIAHVNEQPPSFADRRPDIDIHPAFEAVVLQALSKDREERQPTVDVLLEQLEDLVQLHASDLADRSGVGEQSPEVGSAGPVAAPRGGLNTRRSMLRGSRGRRRLSSALPEPVNTAGRIDALTLWPGIALGLVWGGATLAALSLGGPYARLVGGVAVLGVAVYAGWRGRWVAVPTKLSEPQALEDLAERVRLAPGVEPHLDGPVTHHVGVDVETGRAVLVCVVDRQIDGWPERVAAITEALATESLPSPDLRPIAFGTWGGTRRPAWLCPLVGEQWLDDRIAMDPLSVVEALHVVRALARAWGHYAARSLRLGLRPSMLRLGDPQRVVPGLDVLRSMGAASSGPFAPELVSPGGVADERTEIYLLGGVLRACLVGAVEPADPVAGWQPFARARPDTTIHPAAEAVVRQMMAAAPSERPQSMDQVIRHLDALLALERGIPYAEVAHDLPLQLDLRPIPGGDVIMSSLYGASIDRLVQAAQNCGMYGPRRDRLLAGLDPSLRATLDDYKKPADQLRGDLETLARVPPSGDGHPPLAIWLANARYMVDRGRVREAATFAVQWVATYAHWGLPVPLWSDDLAPVKTVPDAVSRTFFGRVVAVALVVFGLIGTVGIALADPASPQAANFGYLACFSAVGLGVSVWLRKFLGPNRVLVLIIVIFAALAVGYTFASAA